MSNNPETQDCFALQPQPGPPEPVPHPERALLIWDGPAHWIEVNPKTGVRIAEGIEGDGRH